MRKPRPTLSNPAKGWLIDNRELTPRKELTLEDLEDAIKTMKAGRYPERTLVIWVNENTLLHERLKTITNEAIKNEKK